MTLKQVRGSAVDATTSAKWTWSTTSNAVDGTYGTNNATYATATSNNRNATDYIEIGGFDGAGKFGDIPAGATINSVTIKVRHYESNTGLFDYVNVQPFESSTPIGTAQAATLVTTATTYSTTAFTPTLAQLQSTSFTIRVEIDRPNITTSCTFYLDYVDIEVDYTPAALGGAIGPASETDAAVVVAYPIVQAIGAAVETDEVPSGGVDNLLTENEASFETSIGAAWGDSCTVARSTAQAKHGSYSVLGTQTTGTGYIVYLADKGTLLGTLSGETITVYAAARAGAASSTEFRVEIQANTGNYWIDGDAFEPLSTTAWAVQSFNFTVPSGVTSAWLAVRVTDSSGTGSAYTDEFGIWVGTDTTWALPGEIGGLGKSKAKALGAATEADSAAAISSPVSGAPITPAAESDATAALGAAKRRALTPAAETDAAVGLPATKVRAVGPASQADAAGPLTSGKTRAPGAAVEVGSAVGLAATKTAPVASAAESDTAVAVSAVASRAVAPASETDDAVLLAATKTSVLTSAVETDTAVAIASTAVVAITPAAESDAAATLGVTKTTTLTPALETGTAVAVGRTKSATPTPAVEVDTAATVAQPGTIAQPITAATETDTAVGLTRSKARAPAQAGEADSAMALSATKASLVTPAAEVDSAVALSAAKRAALTPAAEVDTSVGLRSPIGAPLTAALETDAAVTLSQLKRVTLQPAAETNASATLSTAKRSAVGWADETDAAVTLVILVRGKATSYRPAVPTAVGHGPAVPSAAGHAPAAASVRTYVP